MGNLDVWIVSICDIIIFNIKYWVEILHANDNKYVKKCITC